MRTDLDALFQAAAILVAPSNMAGEAVGDAIVALLSSIARFDHVVMFGYLRDEKPVHVYSTFNDIEFDIFVTQYLAGPYLLDPFYRNALDGREGVWRMRELAPDRFFSSEYYRSYYSKTALAEEIGFFISLENEVMLVVSLMRGHAIGMFSPPEFAQVRKVFPLISAICLNAWPDISDRFKPVLKTTSERKSDTVWDRLRSRYMLTAREAAIIELVLQGHSSESVGMRLGITTGTVKVHRRNVYRKLGISSQTQLFSMFFST